MEKKKYIVLLLQIAAVAAAGVIGGDTLFALVTALIGITFNFMVSMNFAPGFLFGFVYAVCNGILAWQTKVYATFVFMIFRWLFTVFGNGEGRRNRRKPSCGR